MATNFDYTQIPDTSNCIITGYNTTLPSSLDIPSVINGLTVVEIDVNAFSGCSSLLSLAFNSPSSLSTIGEFAFNGCNSLTSLIFPSDSSLK